MRIGSLFSGIGGLELGLEQATGARTVWQVEREPFCLRVLAKHWPDATRFDDVCTATALPAVDIVCGGFPCQDISSAGKGAGLDGKRSGLWREYRRIVDEVKPACVVVENVARLATKGLDRVIADLADLGFVGEWHMVSAASVGAPHLRRRIFIIATHPERVQLRKQQGWGSGEAGQRAPIAGYDGASRDAADADVQRVDVSAGPQREHVSDAERHGESRASAAFDKWDAADAHSPLVEGGRIPCGGHPQHADVDVGGDWWGSRPAPPAVRRMDDGVSAGMDRPRRRRPPNDKRRLHALGNAVVPQVAYVVGLRVNQILRG